MKRMKLGEELPKISRTCVNNANSLPSLYNNPCFECEIINKREKTKKTCIHHSINNFSLKFFFARSALSIAWSIGAAVLNT